MHDGHFKSIKVKQFCLRSKGSETKDTYQWFGYQGFYSVVLVLFIVRKYCSVGGEGWGAGLCLLSSESTQ